MTSVERSDSQCEKKDYEVESPSIDGTLVNSSSLDSESGEFAKPRTSWLLRWFARSSTNKSTPSADDVDEDTANNYSVVTRYLEHRPRGYPQVATFQSSDGNFLQYRAFKYLRCRLISDLQYDVQKLEQELDELDSFEQLNGKQLRVYSKRRDVHKSAEDMAAEGYPEHLTRCRSIILAELRSTLVEYDNLVLKSKEMMSLQRPANQDYESVRTWFRDNKPLVDSEAQFIRVKEDIVSLRSGRESAIFEGFVERCLTSVDDALLRYFGCQIIRKLFLTPELRAKTDSDRVRYYAPSRVNKLVNILITAVVFILLVLPVIIMYKVTEMNARKSPLDAIGVLIVFTLIFGMAVSSLTTAKRHELFGASAAYAAVLVVFIGNFGVQQVDPATPAAWSSVLGQSISP